MFKARRRDGNYQRLARDSTEIHRYDDDDDSVFHAFEVEDDGHKSGVIPVIATNILQWRALRTLHKRRSSYPARYLRLFIRFATAVILILITLILLTPFLIPSYTYRPEHYTGTNRNSEKVFIAANIVDEDLIRGAWGERVLELIDIIGPDNAFLSIYENDSGPGTKAALRELGQRVKCEFPGEIMRLLQKSANGFYCRQLLNNIRPCRPRQIPFRTGPPQPAPPSTHPIPLRSAQSSTPSPRWLLPIQHDFH